MHYQVLSLQSNAAAHVNVPKVSALQSRRLALCDVEGDLESRVQDVEQAVGKPPEEEEDSDEGHGNDGLASGDLACPSDLTVVDALATSVHSDSLSGGWTACLLLVDLVQCRLVGPSKELESHGVDVQLMYGRIDEVSPGGGGNWRAVCDEVDNKGKQM